MKASKFSDAQRAFIINQGENVVATLERVCGQIGYPKTIRVDQGSEFISRDMDLWAYPRGVTLNFCRPGKPADKAFIEAFNGRLRAECLNAHRSLSDLLPKDETATPSMVNSACMSPFACMLTAHPVTSDSVSRQRRA